MRSTTAVARRVGAWLAGLALLAVALMAALPAAAHDVAGELRVHAIVQQADGRLRVALRVPLELMLNVDLPKRGNGYIDLQRFDEAVPRALAAAARDIEFLADGRRLEPAGGEARIALPSDRSFESFETAAAAIAGTRLPPHTDVYWNQGYFDALVEYPLAAAAPDLAIDFRVAPGLRDRLRLDLRYTTPDGAVRAFDLATGDGAVALDPRWHQAARTFAASGARHILGGIDHLLFLLCLVIPFRRPGWALLGVVTAFTLAHSVTLMAAALGWVPSSPAFPPLVETLIALSIVTMAIGNVVGPRLQSRWLLTALFGLVHGFGFSFGLANELQFAGSHLVLSLLAFNVGIEAGQLLVLLLIWPLLTWARRHMGASERLWLIVLSAFVAHEAWHWTVERATALAATGAEEVLALLWPQGLSVLLALAALWMLLRWRALQRPSTPAAAD